MKTILTVLVTAILVVLVLRSELTPWRIVSKADLDQRRQSSVVERRVAVPVRPAANHSGDWMHDPNYRSALEKTTIVGRPENATLRDANKPTSTPDRKP